MKIKIIPQKLDGEITLTKYLSPYFIGGNVIGNRVRVIAPDRDTATFNASFTNTLLSFNARGTKLKLEAKYVPIVSVVACFACSKTEISLIKKDNFYLENIASVLNGLGATANMVGDNLIILGKSQLNGGSCRCNDKNSAISVITAGTNAQNPIIMELENDLFESIRDFMAVFIKLGGKIEIE